MIHATEAARTSPAGSVPGARAGKARRFALSATTRGGMGFFLPVFALLSLLITLWILATTLMAYPDEPSHTIKAAAVSRGQFFPGPGESFGHGVHVQVPSYIANVQAQMCFPFQVTKPAGCAPAIPLDDNDLTIGVTSAGLYNPFYYWLVGLPSLVMSGAPAIYAMRIVSGLLSAAFYAAGFTALYRLRHPKWPLVAAAISTTPMVLFLGSGINPNSLEIAASMAAFCGLVSVLENSRHLERARPGILTVGIAAATLANTRNISLLWLLCGAIVACLFFRRADIVAIFRNRVVLVVTALATVGIVLGVAWNFLMLRAPASAGEAPAGISNVAGEVRPYNAFLTMMDKSFDFVGQYIGVAGWLDAPVPQAVQMFWSMLLIGLMLTVMLVRPYRLQAAFWVAVALLAVVPAVVQAALINTTGFIWQGRYSLPLFTIAVISAGLAMRFRPFGQRPQSMTIARILLVAGCVAHAYAFVNVLRRYVVGIQETANWQTMFTVPGWQPPLTWEVLTLAFTAAVLLCASKLFSYLFPGHTLLPKRPWPSRTRRARKRPAAEAAAG